MYGADEDKREPLRRFLTDYRAGVYRFGSSQQTRQFVISAGILVLATRKQRVFDAHGGVPPFRDSLSVSPG